MTPDAVHLPDKRGLMRSLRADEKPSEKHSFHVYCIWDSILGTSSVLPCTTSHTHRSCPYLLSASSANPGVSRFAQRRNQGAYSGWI